MYGLRHFFLGASLLTLAQASPLQAQTISDQLYMVAARQHALSTVEEAAAQLSPLTPMGSASPAPAGMGGGMQVNPDITRRFRVPATRLQPGAGTNVFVAPQSAGVPAAHVEIPAGLGHSVPLAASGTLNWSKVLPAQQFTLATDYLHGISPTMTLGDASKVFEQAADSVDWVPGTMLFKQKAQVLAAQANQFGWTGKVDLAKARGYWSDAAASQDPDAMMGYSDFLAASKQPGDMTKSRQLVKDAAQLDQPVAVLKSYDFARQGLPGFDLAKSFGQVKTLADRGNVAASIVVGDNFRQKASADPASARSALQYYSTGLADGTPIAKGRVGALLMKYTDLAEEPAAAGLKPLELVGEAADAGDVDSLLTLSARALSNPDDPFYNPEQAFNMASVASDFASPGQEAQAQAERIDACRQSESCTTRPVFFATDRQMQTLVDGTVRFDNAPDPNHLMHLGVSYVVVWKAPPQTGGQAVLSFIGGLADKLVQLAIPAAAGSFAPPVSSDMVPVKSVSMSMTPADFFAWMKQQEAGQPGAPDRVFAFVHGFATTFDDSVRGAAQVAVNLAYPGIPIALSWASRGNTAQYGPDSSTVRSACADFQKVLVAIGDTFGFEKIDLLAHSMGSQLTFSILTNCAYVDVWPSGAKVGNLVLAAPDVSRDDFSTFLDQMQARSEHRTIYVSSHDQALYISSGDLVNFGPRLGQGGDDRFVHAGVDTIDASPIEGLSAFDGTFGHGYVFQRWQVQDDLGQLLNQDFNLSTRNCLAQGDSGNKPYMVVLETCRGSP